MSEGRRARLRMTTGSWIQAAFEAFAGGREGGRGGEGSGEWFGINQYWSSVNNRNEDPLVNSPGSPRIRGKAYTSRLTVTVR